MEKVASCFIQFLHALGNLSDGKFIFLRDFKKVFVDYQN